MLKENGPLKKLFSTLLMIQSAFLVIEHYVFRNDKTPLPGFDENEYVINTDANDIYKAC
jgi:hypothetical protein